MTPTKKQVNEQLRYSWTRKGVQMWWDRPHPALNDRTPRQAWDEGDKQKVYDVAESGREMTCT